MKTDLFEFNYNNMNIKPIFSQEGKFFKWLNYWIEKKTIKNIDAKFHVFIGNIGNLLLNVKTYFVSVAPKAHHTGCNFVACNKPTMLHRVC